MPPPRIPAPEFSPFGRYLLNVEDRKVQGPTFFHDTENFKEECGIEVTPSGSQSRFNNLNWALKRGYLKCEFCFANQA